MDLTEKLKIHGFDFFDQTPPGEIWKVFPLPMSPAAGHIPKVA
jgi:hypothetical protein